MQLVSIALSMGFEESLCPFEARGGESTQAVLFKLSRTPPNIIRLSLIKNRNKKCYGFIVHDCLFDYSTLI